MSYIPVKTLIVKELKRFIRVPGQTIGAPVATTILFFLVFGFSIGRRIGIVEDLSYTEFIMPGLMMMNVLMSAFFSVSSAILLSKLTNTLSDILVSPMSYLDMTLGFTIASVLRSVCIALLIFLTALFFVPFRIEHPMYLLSFLIIVSFAFSLLGLIIGLWAENFEQVSIFPTFFITPLSFLGGVFYSIGMLPPLFQTISKFNPFLYMINGIRYGFYGVSDVNPGVAYTVGIALLGILMVITWNLFRTGYKIKN